jgi:hypothetical protein
LKRKIGVHETVDHRGAPVISAQAQAAPNQSTGHAANRFSARRGPRWERESGVAPRIFSFELLGLADLRRASNQAILGIGLVRFEASRHGQKASNAGALRRKSHLNEW